VRGDGDPHRSAGIRSDLGASIPTTIPRAAPRRVGWAEVNGVARLRRVGTVPVGLVYVPGALRRSSAILYARLQRGGVTHAEGERAQSERPAGMGDGSMTSPKRPVGHGT
jgi:hypothetical protein